MRILVGAFSRPAVQALALVALVAALSCSGEEPRSSSPTAPAVTLSSSPEHNVVVRPPAAATVVIAAQPSATPALELRAPRTQPADPTLELVGHTDLGGRGFSGNVRALDGFAYVGSWGAGQCPALGVRIVDLADPVHPAVVGTAARFPGTTAEDVVPLRVDTPAFRGNLLAVGIQRCSSSPSGAGGLALVDISDPRNPVDLGFFGTGAGPRGVHELDVTSRDGRVLALLAVPSGETYGAGDFQIIDITDPRNPVRLSFWGARTGAGLQDGVGCSRSVYDHSVRGSADGTRAYLSYWDAGVIIMDISDPDAPSMLGRAVDPGAEGAIHSIDITPEGLLLVTAENDVFQTPRGLRLRAEGGGATLDVAGCQAPASTELDKTGAIDGPLVFAAEPCSSIAAPAGAIVLVSSGGGCGNAAKARRARTAGARAIILIEGSSLVTPFSDESDLALPLVAIGPEDGARLRAMVSAGDVRVTLPSARPWGGVQIWDVSNPEQPVQRALVRTANAEQFPPPGPGYYTVHNPLSAGRYALFSWYADGVRVFDLADPNAPREVASFVPPAVRDPQGFWPTAPSVWGVALSGSLVLASDINGGLYVLRSTGLVDDP
jgi:hypothetical protein